MPPKPFAFVLMPFSEDFNDTYQLGIKPACEAAGYYCERLDEQIFEERMLDRIYNQIAKADLIVSDMSERNANVFYETGYAHALGKRVIHLTRDADDIPFDLKHHHHIVYSAGIVLLKDALTERAAYYAANPTEMPVNPYSHLSVLVNGENIRLGPGQSNSASSHRSKSGGTPLGENVYPIAVSLELGDASPITEIEFKVRLITPREFAMSSWTSGAGVTHFHSSIKLAANGHILHKPSSDLRIVVGDPTQVVFELYRDRAEPTPFPVTCALRIIASGLRMDIPFMAILEEPLEA